MLRVRATLLPGGPRACRYGGLMSVRKDEPPQQTQRGLAHREEQRKKEDKGKNHRQMNSVVIKDGGRAYCRLRSARCDP